MAEHGRLRGAQQGARGQQRPENNFDKLMVKRKDALMKAIGAAMSGNTEAVASALEGSKSIGSVMKEMQDFEATFMKAKQGQGKGQR